MNDNNEFTFKILSDEPTDKDDFGSHEKVAASISNLIDNEDKGRSVALIGDWGSGKSSVVRMLKTKVENNNIANLFIFDVWTHKGDSIRRAFLEKLIDYFKKFDNFPRRKWGKVKLILAKRYEQTRIDSHSEPTKWSIILAVSIFFVPGGLALLSQWQYIPFALKLLGGLFAGAPLIALFFAYMAYKEADEDDKKSIKSIFVEKGEEKRFTKTYRTPEPTSIEFQQYFKQLIKDGLSLSASKLIIVIDNLDRVDADDARNIWAAMCTFIKTDGDAISEKLWLFVPISESGIKQIWQNGHELADSFESKTFQIRFQIAPPVLKDWRDYFLKQLNRAFPNYKDEEDFHLTYRIYRSEVYTNAGYPTPRDVKIFINKMGAIFLQKSGELKLHIIALYVALNTVMKFKINDLIYRADTILRPTTGNLISLDYPKKLAAIHYNVPEEKALNVLLAPQIEKAIGDRDIGEFTKLQSSYGFAEVLEEVLDDNLLDWVEKDPNIIGVLANNLKNIDPLMDFGCRNIWDRLCEAATRVKKWTGINESTCQGLAELIKYRREAEFCKNILTSLSATPLIDADKDTSLARESVTEWVHGICRIIKSIIDVKLSHVVKTSFSCPGSGPTYIDILNIIAGDKELKRIARYLKPQASSKAINAALSSIISSGSFEETIGEIIDILNNIEPDWPWGDVAEAISDRIQLIDEIKLPEIEYLLQIFLDLSEWNDDAKTHLKDLSSKGHLFNYLSMAHNENGKVTALAILIIFDYNPTFLASVTNGQIPAGIEHINNLLKKPQDYNYAFTEFTNLVINRHRINWLLKILAEQPDKVKFLHFIIYEICKRDDVILHFTVKTIIKYETDFYNALGEDYRAIIAKYVTETELLNELKSSEFNARLSSLYLAAYLAQEEKDSGYVEHIVTGLKGIAEDVWVKELKAKCDNLFDLTAQISKDDIEINLSRAYLKALIDYERKVLTGKNIKKIDEQWHSLLRALDSDIRQTHLTNIAEEIIEKDGPYEKVIDLFGPDLLECEALQSIADDIVRRGFNKFFIKDRLRELKWLGDIFRSCPRILKESKRQFKKDLKESIRDELEKVDFDSEKGKLLKEIAIQLKVDIPKDDSNKNPHESNNK